MLTSIAHVGATASVRGTRVPTGVDSPSPWMGQDRLLTETVTSAAPETPIPTCPGWNMRQLLRHVGRAHRWAAEIIGTRADVERTPDAAPGTR
jgi:hypothetical protein